MSAQDQRPKSSASSTKSAARKSEDQQRGHQLSDDGPVAPSAAGGNQDAYQPLSDDQEQPEAGAEEKADKPKKENPLKKFIASLKSLNCTGKPANFDKANKKNGGEKNGSNNGDDEDEDEHTPNARPVSQSSLESKKVAGAGATEKNAPQIEVSQPSAEDMKDEEEEQRERKEDERKAGEEQHHNEKLASPVEGPSMTTTISATPPTL
ncbi:hypothetical protein QBC45DRAFT_209913 [Copromyces sp. CBS 386.78]|nr:hypothetical protein QBC45DRAFT_209913 [Copromyces sp. CBS 386.78]